ncbi:MAG: hypothetical protein M1812_005546 [Candelaria pacifica]|nr:MAG: hypothetical protein M1812_005546 [Candelaria pacifica]
MLPEQPFTPFPFERLPRAIRKRILHHVLVTEEVIYLGKQSATSLGVALFRTSKRLRAESLSMFWTKNKFLIRFVAIHLNNGHYQYSEWLRNFLAQNITRISHLTIDMEIEWVTRLTSAETKHVLYDFVESLQYCMHQQTLSIYFSRFGTNYGNNWSRSVNCVQPFGVKPLRMPWLASNQAFRFRDLPGELRNKVYERLAPEDVCRTLYQGKGEKTGDGSNFSTNHQIILVNHQIRAEAIPIFKQNVRYELDATLLAHIPYVRAGIAGFGPKNIHHVLFKTGTPLWHATYEGIPYESNRLLLLQIIAELPALRRLTFRVYSFTLRPYRKNPGLLELKMNEEKEEIVREFSENYKSLLAGIGQVEYEMDIF